MASSPNSDGLQHPRFFLPHKCCRPCVFWWMWSHVRSTGCTAEATTLAGGEPCAETHLDQPKAIFHAWSILKPLRPQTHSEHIDPPQNHVGACRGKRWKSQGPWDRLWDRLWACNSSKVRRLPLDWPLDFDVERGGRRGRPTWGFEYHTAYSCRLGWEICMR